MADFSVLEILANAGNVASPSWKNLAAAAKELRWHSTAAAGLTTTSAAWPSVSKPGAGTVGLDYAYAYTADAVGHGVYGGADSSAPAAFATSQYLQFRVSWDNLGTFAAAPIITAYPTTGHGAISRGDGSLLGGHASDTGATARSYLKGAAWGRVGSAGAPGAGPGAAPVVTDGTTGVVSPAAGANWSGWQGFQGDNDWIAFPSTPAGVTADTWAFMLRLFIGANLTPGVLTPVFAFKYVST